MESLAKRETQSLIKKEIQSLERIRTFGLIGYKAKAVSIKLSLNIPFYPPPSFSYAYADSNRLVKVGKKFKAFILLDEHEAELGCVIGTKEVILPCFNYYFTSSVLTYFRGEGAGKTLCAVAISKYSKKLERLDKYDRYYGTAYMYNFKTPHQIRSLGE